MPKNTSLTAYRAGERSAQRRVGKHRRPKITLPLAVVAGFVPLGISVYNARDTGLAGIGATISKRLTGYDPATAKWSWEEMRCGTFSIILGMLVHWLVGQKMGVNRMLARSGIPVLRI